MADPTKHDDREREGILKAWQEYWGGPHQYPCENFKAGWLAARQSTVGVEEVQELLDETKQFGSYAKVLMQDNHVTRGYLEGYRRRFITFEQAYKNLQAKIGGQR